MQKIFFWNFIILQDNWTNKMLKSVSWIMKLIKLFLLIIKGVLMWSRTQHWKIWMPESFLPFLIIHCSHSSINTYAHGYTCTCTHMHVHTHTHFPHLITVIHIFVSIPQETTDEDKLCLIHSLLSRFPDIQCYCAIPGHPGLPVPPPPPKPAFYPRAPYNWFIESLTAALYWR